MMPGVGGVIAQIDRRGSRYVTDGTVRGWMPVPTDGRESDLVHLTIDGERVASGTVDYTGKMLLAGNGYVDRYLFTLELPAQERDRQIRFALITDGGAPVGDEITLDVDASGRDIGSNKELKLGVLELVHHPRALRLSNAAVEAVSREALC
jgi:hypothetical protein